VCPCQNRQMDNVVRVLDLRAKGRHMATVVVQRVGVELAPYIAVVDVKATLVIAEGRTQRLGLLFLLLMDLAEELQDTRA